jgi:hypothetical protein
MTRRIGETATQRFYRAREVRFAARPLTPLSLSTLQCFNAWMNP